MEQTVVHDVTDGVVLLFQSNLPSQPHRQLALLVARSEVALAEDAVRLVEPTLNRIAEIERDKFNPVALSHGWRPALLRAWLDMQSDFFGVPDPGPKCDPLGNLNFPRLRALPGQLAVEYVETWIKAMTQVAKDGDPTEALVWAASVREKFAERRQYDKQRFANA